MTSHDKPIFRKFDVIHYCVPNIASRVARTATYAMSNIFTSILLDFAELGGLKMQSGRIPVFGVQFICTKETLQMLTWPQDLI